MLRKTKGNTDNHVAPAKGEGIPPFRIPPTFTLLKEPSKMKSKFNLILILWLLTIVPSLRPIAKYLPTHFLIFTVAYGLASLGAITVIINFLAGKHRSRFINSKTLFSLIVVVITAVNFFIYPIADGLKKELRGSDQDDAIIQTGQMLLSGHNPYHAHLYTGNKISPGPGIILLAIPFSGYSRYFLFTPCALLITGLITADLTGSFLFASAFLLLLALDPVFWEIMVAGSDMIVIGILFAIATALLYKWQLVNHGIGCQPAKNSARNWISGLVIAIFCAAIATSRVIFIELIPLWTLFLYKTNKRSALYFFCTSLTFALALHLSFYLPDPPAYSPLHIIGKGEKLVSPMLRIVAALVAVFAGLWIALKTQQTLTSWMISLAIACAVPLAGASFGDLITHHWNFSIWEGANYLMIISPIICMWSVLSLKESPCCEVN